MSGTYVESSYPNFRKFVETGVKFPTGSDWLRAKRKVDNLGSTSLWRVHDKLYNLSSFIDLHPGGRDWIETTRGTDITEAFETSHLVNVEKVDAILAKYYVRDADVGHVRNSPYTFEEDGFYKTLKRRVRPLLEEIGTGPSPALTMLQDSLVLLYATTALVGASYSSTLVQIMSGFLLGMSVVCAHNFAHMKDTWRRFYLDLCPFTSYDFRITHNLSHHMFPNTVLDYESESLSIILDTRPGKDKRGYIRGVATPFLAHIFYTQLFTLSFISWIRLLFRKEVRPEQGLIALQVLGFFYFSPDILTGIKCFLIVFAGASYWIGFLSNSHHHPACFHDGDQPISDCDFGLRQLDTVLEKNDAVHSTLLAISTTFGEHPLHHLFPTVCQSKLSMLKPIFEQTLEEFQTKNRKVTQLELFRGTYQQYMRDKELTYDERKKNLP